MSIEFLYSGLAAGLVAALVACLLTYWFQKQLLNQQLDFQKRLLDQQLAFQEKQAIAEANLRRQINDEWRALLTDFRNVVNKRAASMIGGMSPRQPQAE